LQIVTPYEEREKALIQKKKEFEKENVYASNHHCNANFRNPKVN
jgi:hypothetical protein